jgi:hypothetical protein
VFFEWNQSFVYVSARRPIRVCPGAPVFDAGSGCWPWGDRCSNYKNGRRSYDVGGIDGRQDA